MKIWWVVINMKVNGTNYCFHDGYEADTKLDAIAKAYRENFSPDDNIRVVNCYEVSSR
jgi:hypothetical protein